MCRPTEIGCTNVVTLALAQPTSAQSGEFELELSNHRWTLSSSMFDIFGAPESHDPSTDLIVATKHPNDRSVTRGVIENAIHHQKPFHYQSRIVRSDGHLRTVESTGSVAVAPDGTPQALLGTVSVVSNWDAPVFTGRGDHPVSEGDLAVALLARVEESYAYVFREFASVVARASRRVLRDAVQVDDVVQTVFEELWRHPSRFDPGRGSLATYLSLRAYSRSIDLVRSESSRAQRTRPESCEPHFVDSPEDAFLASGPCSEVVELLAHLPRRERECIELAYFGDMTYRAVAAQLGLPEGTVKSRIRFGLLHLRDLANKPS